MAVSVSPEALSTLKITYEALVERSKLLLDDQQCQAIENNSNDSPNKSRTSGEGSTRGVLHLPPTTKLVPKEKQKRGRRGRSHSHQDQTRLMPAAQNTSDHRLAGHEDRMAIAGKRAKFKPESRGSELRGRTTHRSASGGRDGGSIGPEQGDLSSGWSQHEHRKVEKMLSRWSGDVAKLKPVIKACQHMQESAESVLGRDMEMFSKQDISTKLWKQGHYPIIEALRGRLSADSGAKDTLGTFLADSIAFYSKLRSQVELQLSFKVSELLSNKVEFTSKTHCRKVMLAAVLCHHWCISLGDLSRYQQSLTEDADWSKPRRYYQHAQQLVPKAGKPYNQLAVVAINTHRRLDAIYYYMRSLSTRPAFQSAYDSLVGIFADTSRKVEKLEEGERRVKKRREAEAARKQKRAEQRQRKKQSRQHKQQSEQELDRGTVVQEFVSGKKEVWIMPGASGYDREKLQAHDVSQDAGAKSHDLSPTADRGSPVSPSSSPQLLVRKMTAAFVQIHGKLFTRTGLERLVEATQRMLRYCRELLRVGGTLRVEYSLLLLKMTAINIFAVHHAADTYADNPTAQTHHCGMSLTFALQVASVLLGACVEKLKATPTTNSVAESAEWSELLDYLAVLLPAVRVLLVWFLGQEELLSTSLTAVKQPILLEFWTTLVSFLNLTSGEAWPNSQGATPTSRLWEERALAGFIHLKATLSTKDTFTIADVKRMSKKHHQEQSAVRVSMLNNLCQQLLKARGGGLTGVRGTTFSFDEESRKYLLLDTGAAVSLLEAEQGEGERKGEGEREEGGEEGETGSQPLDESFELAESSLSLGFSDSDSSDDVVEILTDDEEEEEKWVEPEEEGEKWVEPEGGGAMVGTDEQRVEPEPEKYLPEKVESSEIEQLKAQRDNLVKQMEENTLARAVAKTVLSEAASKASREVLITPRYLVPDTNCFVKMLPSIKALVGRAEFVVAIPLIVIRELEGLSKGAPPPSAVTGAERQSNPEVTSGAKGALEYIHTSFQTKVSHLKALTTQGSLLATLTFRDQLTEKVSNDDLILQSCQQLHIRTATTKPGVGSSTEYKVVMLTGDRNLRVKAHASDQPVKDIPNFMKLLSK